MILYIAAAAALGGLLGFLIAYVIGQKSHERSQRELVSQRIQLERENAELSARIESYRQQLEGMEASKQQMRQEFENLSNRIFEGASQRLTNENRHAVSSLLDPFREQMREFKDRVERVYDSESKDRRSLFEQIKQLKELNDQLNEEAAHLTQALKGDTKKQGAWGELILSRVLEESGLRQGIEYEQQSSFRDEQGRLKRPDVIIHLPENKEIIVDSKVSLTAYEQYVSSNEEAEASAALSRHVSSIRSHIKELSDKSYEDIAGINCLDYVLMFIPIESAFITAVEHERGLFNEAYRKNIILVSPSTLLVTLRTIHNIWRYERQNANAQEIAQRAGRLYDKFAGFVESLEAVGTSLEKSRQSLDQAVSRLSTGKGNLLTQVESIRKLGARNKRRIELGSQDNSGET
jgi:DNA recombination protein RmuC